MQLTLAIRTCKNFIYQNHYDLTSARSRQLTIQARKPKGPYQKPNLTVAQKQDATHDEYR